MLKFGFPPLVNSKQKTILEISEAIRLQKIEFPTCCSNDFEDLISTLMAKLPDERGSLDLITLHPFLDKELSPPFLARKFLTEPPTEAFRERYTYKAPKIKTEIAPASID